MDLPLLNLAHQNWENFIRDLTDEQKKSLNEIAQPVASVDLIYYASIKDYARFDQSFNILTDSYRYEEELIPVIYQMYQERDLHELAFEYLLGAEAYYFKAGMAITAEIKLLFDNSENISLLKKYKLTLERIRNILPKSIAKITPEIINNKRDLNKFILNEIIQALRVLKEKIEGIRQITHENRFNDLLQAILRLRLPIWGWSIPDQPRVGTSPGGKDAGSADILFQAGNGTNIALIEAFILRDKPYTEIHILKCPKYIGTINKFYVVVYHLKSAADFDANWASYKSDVLGLTYPAEFQVDVAEGFCDIATEFDDVVNFKIAFTKHPNGVELFHIMLNLGS